MKVVHLVSEFCSDDVSNNWQRQVNIADFAGQHHRAFEERPEMDIKLKIFAHRTC